MLDLEWALRLRRTLLKVFLLNVGTLANYVYEFNDHGLHRR